MAPEDQGRPAEPRSTPQSTNPAAEGLAHGITIAASIVLFLWLGDLLDGRLGTSPLFAFLGLFFGAGASFYRMYVHLVVLPREKQKARDEDGST